VSLNDPIQEMIFPRADDPILTHVVEEGNTVEPELYFPIIAMPLVLGSRGIATGWSTEIPPHHPIHVIDATLSYMDGGTECTLSPWYRGFGGDIHPNLDGATNDMTTSYTVRGRYEWNGSDRYVTEVPPNREVEAYKEDWIRGEFASDVVPGDGNLDERVEVVLRNCTLPRNEPLFSKLGIERRISYTNMHLLNFEGRLIHYDTVWDIIRDHATLRRRAYERRIEHTISVLERKLMIARNRATFITLTTSGSIDLRRAENDDDAFQTLSSHGLDTVDASYDYLLNMSMRHLTIERSARLTEDAVRMEKELQDARALTVDGEWRRELHLLRGVLEDDVRYRLT
jgi:DNA topoisomerase-2